MRKTLLITAIVVAFTGIGLAQDTDFRDKLSLGVKVGANLSNVYDVEGNDFEAGSKFGFVAGGFLSIPIGTYLGVQPEILFSQKGYAGSGSFIGIDYEYKRTTNFIDVPILIQFKPVPAVTIVGGPQYSYLIKQSDNFDSEVFDADQIKEFDNDNLRKNILCFLGGIDVNMNNLTLGLRAGWDIQNNNGDGSSSIPLYKNVWYQGTLGFRF